MNKSNKSTKNKQRAISIKGQRHNPYSHVIFLMKDKEEPVIDFIAEAERIINTQKSKPADIEEVNGIKKIVIRESKISKLFMNTTMLITSIGLLIGMWFLLIL